MHPNSSHTICILGCGGFIGSHLLERLLQHTSWYVYGIDRSDARIAHLLGHERLHFECMDASCTDRVRPFIEKSDAVVSLIALCNPSLYNTVAREVIDANFLQPYEIVKLCERTNTWLVHFSTSEVYGKTPAALGVAAGSEPQREHDEGLLHEEHSPCIYGNVQAQRWSYACAKQLLERTIYAMGKESGLPYTVVRPFNFLGPRMDYIPGIDGEGIPRVLACFMEALLFQKPLQLVDGGKNRRVFTYIDDAIDAVMCILQRPQQAMGEIFNIGHPDNEASIEELADMMIELYSRLRPEYAGYTFTKEWIDAGRFYGEGYEDSDQRRPDISKARTRLQWEPRTSLYDTLYYTMAAYIRQYAEFCVQGKKSAAV